MKLSKLFKKAESFFGLNDEEQIKKSKKREKLESALKKKIIFMKKKIKESDNEQNKSYLKKELEVLKKLSEKLSKGE